MKTQPHEREDRQRRAGARLLGDVSLAADRGDAGLCRLRLGADRLRARQHRPRRRRADGDGLRRRRHHADRPAEDQLRKRHPGRDGPRRDGRAGAARQHRRGRAPRRGRRSSSAPAPRAGSRPARAPTAGASARACPTSSSQANAQSLVCVQLEHEAAIAQPGCDPGRRGHRRVLHRPVGPLPVHGLSRQPQGAAGRQGDRRRPWPRIVAAGRTPGMPATAETLADVQAKGCRYIYTHLPRLLGLGAAAFLRR